MDLDLRLSGALSRRLPPLIEVRALDLRHLRV